MKTMLAVLLGLCWFFLPVAGASGGWYYYGQSYRSGCSYYGSCSYGNSYYYPGYWYYYPDPPAITAFVYPVYISTAFAQYAPSAGLTPTYQTNPVQAVQQVQQTSGATAGGAVVTVGTQQGTAQAVQSSAGRAVDPYAACHAKTEALSKEVAEMKALILAMQPKRETPEQTIARLTAENEKLRAGAGDASLPRSMPPAADDDTARVQAVAALLVSRCYDCHNVTDAGKRKGGTSWFTGPKDNPNIGTADGKPLSLQKWDEIVTAVASNGAAEMPPAKQQKDYPKLTAPQQGEVAWLRDKIKASLKK